MTDEIETTRTAPRRASPRDAPRKGALLIAGTGSDSASLGQGRLVVLDDAADLGRRPPSARDRTAVTLPDRTVSSLHARVTGRDGSYFVEDAGSTNGTMVDGRRISGSPVPLREGAVLSLGAHVLVFRTVTSAEVAAIEADLADPFAPVPTLSPALALVCAKLRKLAPSSSELFLLGETGVGKEVFAGAIHRCSGRTGPLVAINCAALPRELIESELFGYERGAHSMAKASKEGLIETACGGTLFLDELGEMPLEAQGKLLRFIQDRTYLPIGATKTRTADVRILAASSRASGPASIQAALMGRLGAEPITLPALRDRIEDIGHLTSHFLTLAKSNRGLTDDAFLALFLHSWPLNVRELGKVIGEAELLSRDAPAIDCEHLPGAVVEALDRDAGAGGAGASSVLPPPPNSDAKSAARERRPVPGPDELRALLVRYNGNVAHVAKHLDRQWAVISRTLRRYGIDPAPYRPSAEGGGETLRPGLSPGKPSDDDDDS